MGEKGTGAATIIPQTYPHRTNEKARWNRDPGHRHRRIVLTHRETWAWHSLSPSRNRAKSRVRAVGEQSCASITEQNTTSRSATLFLAKQRKNWPGTLRNTWNFPLRKRSARSRPLT